MGATITYTIDNGRPPITACLYRIDGTNEILIECQTGHTYGDYAFVGVSAGSYKIHACDFDINPQCVCCYDLLFTVVDLTPTPTPSITPTITPTNCDLDIDEIPLVSVTPTPSITMSSTPTLTPTPSRQTPTPTPTITTSITVTPTVTPSSETPTPTPTITSSVTTTPTVTPSNITPTPTPTITSSVTVTPTITPSSETPTPTPTATVTPSPIVCPIFDISEIDTTVNTKFVSIWNACENGVLGEYIDYEGSYYSEITIVKNIEDSINLTFNSSSNSNIEFIGYSYDKSGYDIFHRLPEINYIVDTERTIYVLFKDNSTIWKEFSYHELSSTTDEICYETGEKYCVYFDINEYDPENPIFSSNWYYDIEKTTKTRNGYYVDVNTRNMYKMEDGVITLFGECDGIEKINC